MEKIEINPGDSQEYDETNHVFAPPTVEITREEYNRLRARSAMLDTVKECYADLVQRTEIMVKQSIAEMEK